MGSPGLGRRIWLAALSAWAAFVAWEASRYFLAPGGRRGRFHVESPLFILVALCVATALWRSGASPATPETEDRPRGGARALVACLLWALVLYWPALSLGFLSDDFVLLDRARRGGFLEKTPGGFWRPLPDMLFAFLGSAPILHGLNVGLHGLNGWMVARLARAVGLAPRPSWAAAFLFLAFPAGPEAVAWCSGIQDVAMTTAVLGGLLAWRLVPGAAAAAALSVFCLVAGLATKETAVVAPALGVALWLGAVPPRRLWLVGGTLMGVAVAFGLWHLSAGSPPQDYAQPLTRGILKELLARSFGGLGAPFHSDLGTLKTALGLASGVAMPFLLVANAVAWRDDRRGLVRALRLALWVVLAVAPVYAYLTVGPDLQGSRYLYLPAAGWSMLVVELSATALTRAGVPRQVTAGLAVLALATSAAVLRLHLRPWQEAAALRDETLAAGLAAARASGCGPGTSFADLPDTVRGAYVFRNGFPQALQEAGPGWPGTQPCAFRWRGSTFGP